MDESQLRRLYQQETSMHVNPPSYETWKMCRERREQYDINQARIRNSPPDEDAWNRHG